MAAVEPVRVDPFSALSLAEALMLLRHRSGKDQRELADMMAKRGREVSAQAISAWENGKPMAPANLRAYAGLFADLLKYDPETLYRGLGYLLVDAHDEDKPLLLLWGSDLRERSPISVPRRTHDT
jgi:transcriptional regulator with XRE-family HTH domain